MAAMRSSSSLSESSSSQKSASSPGHAFANDSRSRQQRVSSAPFSANSRSAASSAANDAANGSDFAHSETAVLTSQENCRSMDGSQTSGHVSRSSMMYSYASTQNSFGSPRLRRWRRYSHLTLSSAARWRQELYASDITPSRFLGING